MLPEDKRCRAVNLLKWFISWKKATVHEIQSLAGLLNFTNRAMYPERVFTRRMYSKVVGKMEILKPHHHVYIDAEFQQDCKVWLQFLDQNNLLRYCRPFTDVNAVTDTVDLGFYTDSSVNARLGFGGIFGDKHWFYGQWEDGYIDMFHPSIEYLELYALLIGLFIYSDEMANRILLLHCDNMSVVEMINKTTSKCPHCMYLLQLMVLRGLNFNFRVRVKHVRSENNGLADSLSRLQFNRFKKLGGNVRNANPSDLPTALWPALKIWEARIESNCVTHTV